MIRPRVPLPTGTEIGAPVACTARPRFKPSEEHMAGAHHTVPQLLLHLERQVHVLELQRLVDPGDGFARKRDVDDGADDLGNLSLAGSGHGTFPQTAAAPPTISESSFVIAAWRALL